MKLIAWEAGGSDTLYHWCPACERLHVIPPKRWIRTGPDESPTYEPSFLQYSVRKLPNNARGNCHYFIQCGEIVFQPDSWHKRNDTVPMPDIPQAVADKLTDEIFRAS